MRKIYEKHTSKLQNEEAFQNRRNDFYNNDVEDPFDNHINKKKEKKGRTIKSPKFDVNSNKPKVRRPSKNKANMQKISNSHNRNESPIKTNQEYKVRQVKENENTGEMKYNIMNSTPKSFEISTKKRSRNFLDNHDLNSPEPSPEVSKKEADRRQQSYQNGKNFYNNHISER